MKMRLSVNEAVNEAVNDLRRLKKGYIGEVTIHAISTDEQHRVASFRGAKPVYYWLWTDNMKNWHCTRQNILIKQHE